jgi:hypothetical protein
MTEPLDGTEEGRGEERTTATVSFRVLTGPWGAVAAEMKPVVALSRLPPPLEKKVPSADPAELKAPPMEAPMLALL